MTVDLDDVGRTTDCWRIALASRDAAIRAAAAQGASLRSIATVVGVTHPTIKAIVDAGPGILDTNV